MRQEKLEKNLRVVEENELAPDQEVDIEDAVDILDKLDPKERRVLLSMVSTQYQGPIPPPEVLRGFEDICSGSADRIITMAEMQSSHRQDIEKKVVASKTGDSRIGLYLAFIVVVISFIGGMFLIAFGKGPAGLTIMAGVLVALVSVFIYGSRNQSKERVEKSKELSKNEAKLRSDEE